MRKFYCVLTTFLFAGLIFVSCSKDDNDSSSKIPDSLVSGNEIVLSKMSPMMFGFFRALSSSTGQWADSAQSTIATSYSSATYTYSLTGSNSARLESTNYQSKTGRRWNITLYLTFETPSSGSYTLRDVELSTGTSYTTKGNFTLR